MSSGGAAPGGTAAFPSYLEGFHHDLLSNSASWSGGSDHGSQTTESLYSVMATYLIDGNNPYHGEESYNPDGEIDNAEAEIDSYKNHINSLDPKTDWESLSDKALAVVDESGNEVFPVNKSFVDTIELAMNDALSAYLTGAGSSAISNDVDAYESNVQARLAEQKSRLAAGMADINAVHSSAFAMAETLLENEAAKDVNSYETKIKLQLFNTVIDTSVKAQMEVIIKKQFARDSYISQSVAEMSRMFLRRTEGFKEIQLSYVDHYMKSIVAKREENRENVEFDFNEAMWDFRVFREGFNGLASISGAVSGAPPEMSPFQSGLSGMMAGAAAGAAITPGNPIGPVVGGGLGLLAGLL